MSVESIFITDQHPVLTLTEGLNLAIAFKLPKMIDISNNFGFYPARARTQRILEMSAPWNIRFKKFFASVYLLIQ